MTDRPGKAALAAIMEAAERATPGPWKRDNWRVLRAADLIGPPIAICSSSWDNGDAAFITAARNNIASVAAYAAGLEAENARLREEIDTWKSVFPDIAPDSVLPSRTAEIAAAVADERGRCAEIAKTGWLSADYNTVGIADADVAVALCEHIAAAIRGGDTS